MRGGFLLLFLFLSSAQAADLRFRVVSANLSSGNQQNYNGGEGLRILKGLRPDVVLIQEFRFRENRAEDFQAFATELGEGYSVHRESTDGDTTGAIPNGVISRFPIMESGEWEDPIPGNRDFVWARLDLPGDRELFAVSLHLKASNDAPSREKRVQEARALISLLREHMSPDDYLVVGGDLNTRQRNEQAIEILGDLVSESRPPQNPTLDETLSGTSMNGRYAYDWVLGNLRLNELQIPVRFYAEGAPDVAIREFPQGLIFDSSVFEPLHVVPGVQAGDSRANGIQHLAVVKDYLLPVADPDGTLPVCQTR